MKINLLVEIQVHRRALAGMRVARVINSAVITVPGHTPAAGGILHPGNPVGQTLAGGDVVNVNRTVLAPVFRERYRQFFAVMRGHHKVHGDGAIRTEEVRVQHRPFGGKVIEGVQGHHPGLLGGRLEFHGKEHAGAGHQAGIIGGGGGV